MTEQQEQTPKPPTPPPSATIRYGQFLVRVSADACTRVNMARLLQAAISISSTNEKGQLHYSVLTANGCPWQLDGEDATLFDAFYQKWLMGQIERWRYTEEEGTAVRQKTYADPTPADPTPNHFNHPSATSPTLCADAALVIAQLSRENYRSDDIFINITVSGHNRNALSRITGRNPLICQYPEAPPGLYTISLTPDIPTVLRLLWRTLMERIRP